MSQHPRIEENQGGNSLQNKLNQWGYTPGKGFASTASQQNTANNTTRENANDRLNQSAVSSAEAGAGGTDAKIKATQQSGQSNNQNNHSSQRNPEQTTVATMRFSEVARTRKKDEEMNPIVLFFPEKDWEKPEQEGGGKGQQGQADEDTENQTSQAEADTEQDLSLDERLEKNRRRVRRLSEIRNEGLLESATGAAQAVNMLQQRHGMASNHINAAAQKIARDGEGRQMLQNLAQSQRLPTTPEASQVKGSMAEGDSVDLG